MRLVRAARRQVVLLRGREQVQEPLQPELQVLVVLRQARVLELPALQQGLALRPGQRPFPRVRGLAFLPLGPRRG